MSNAHADIHRLPLEILQLVLTAAYDSYVCSPGNMDRYVTQYSVLLSSVCLNWRRAATSTPGLWTDIDIKCFEQAQLCFHRSQSASLRVRLLEPDSDSLWSTVDGKVEYRKIKDTMTQNASRFRYLTLSLIQVDHGTDLFAALLPQLRPNNLEFLALQVKATYLQNTPFSHEALGSILKPLRVLHIDKFPIDIQGITCNDLVDLSIHSSFPMSIERLTGVLRPNPRLQSFTLTRNFALKLEPRHVQPISLPQLRTIRLDQYAGPYIAWLFRCLALGPSDLHISLDWIGYGGPVSRGIPEHILEFFRRVPVTSIEIKRADAPISPLLQIIPRLSHLKLSHTRLGDNVLEDAAKDLTKLHTIDLYACEFDGYDTLAEDLRALLTVASVRRVRYLLDPERSPSSEERAALHTVLSREISVELIECPELELETEFRPFLRI